MKFCSKCGKSFEAVSSRMHICDDCRKEAKEKKKAYLREYTRNRNHRLGVKQTAVYDKDHAVIKAMAEEKGIKIPDMISLIVAKCK